MITGGGDSCHSRYADEKSKCLVRALKLKGDRSEERRVGKESRFLCFWGGGGGGV